MIHSFLHIILIVALSIFFSANVMAQKGKKEDAQPSGSKVSSAVSTSTVEGKTSHEKVLNLAQRYNDYAIAINALYYMIAEDPNNIGLKDSLASIYFRINASRQALQLGLEILETDAKNKKILEMVAICFQTLGDYKEALSYYEKLYAITGSVYHQYQIAVIQYGLKRLGECSNTLEQIIKNPESAKEKMGININREQRQEVIIKAAALNVKGVLLRDQKDDTNALKAFEEALQIDPSFELPKGNIEDIKGGTKENK